MKEYDSILMTSEISRKKTVMSRAGLEKAVQQLNEKPLPSYLQHDRRRPIGFVSKARLEQDGDLVRVRGIVSVFETDEEMEEHKSLFAIPYRTGVLRIDTGSGELALEGDCLQVDGFEAFSAEKILDTVFPALASLADSDQLVRFAAMPTPGWFGFESSGYFLFYSRLLRRGFFLFNNFNEEFLQAVVALAKQHSDWDVRVALDHEILGVKRISSGVPMEMDYWYGPKFKGDFGALQDGVTVHGMPAERQFMLQIKQTEFQVTSRGDLKFIKIEELSTPDNWLDVDGERYVGARYAHCIYDTARASFVHLDGAVRLYSQEQYEERSALGMHRFGKRAKQIKTFLINGHVESTDCLQLIHFYFRSNPLVDEYFGIESDEFAHPNFGVQADALDAGRLQ